MARYKNKVVFNDHSDPNERKSGFIPWCYYKFFYFFYQLFLKNRYTIVVPDSSTVSELIARYGKSIDASITECPLGYNSSIFNENNNNRIKDRPLIIGFAGKINPKKNLEKLISASLKFEESEIEICLVGFSKGEPSAYQKSLLEYIGSLGRKNIKTSSFLSDPTELSKFYSSIDVAVFPGAISITTLEASGCGTPVLIYESYPGLNTRVDNGRGYLFTQQEELVGLIKHYLIMKKNSGIDHASISKNSCHYSWSELKKLYYHIYGFSS